MWDLFITLGSSYLIENWFMYRCASCHLTNRREHIFGCLPWKDVEMLNAVCEDCCKCQTNHLWS